MSVRITFIDGKIKSYAAAGRQKPDWKEFFSDSVGKSIPEDLLDEYGNGQYEIEVDWEWVNQEGFDVNKHIRCIKKRMAPTAEQIDKRRKQLVAKEMRKKYDMEDRLALVEDAINALQVGKEISMDYTQMELDREAAKLEADNVIEDDLFKIAEEHKSVSR